MYIVYNTNINRAYKRPRDYDIATFETERGAKMVATRLNKQSNVFVVYSYSEYMTIKALMSKKIVVKNLMTGADVEIDADTPWHMRPDSETYWCM